MFYIPDASYLPVSRVFEYLLQITIIVIRIESFKSISSLPCRFNMFTRPLSNHVKRLHISSIPSRFIGIVPRLREMEIFASRKTFLKLAGKIAVDLLVRFFSEVKSDGEGKVGFDKSCWHHKDGGAESHEKVLGKWRCSKFPFMDFGVSTAFF